jgi:EmrB/QacA subfamily drug resistance transporter
VTIALTEANRKWWTLGAVTFSLFMVMLDTTVVNVALPSIQKDLGTTLSELEWIVNAFLLVYATFLLTGGKLADFLGRRRLFLAGLALFTAASLLCGVAPNGGALIGARAVQGIGAALMLPATHSLIAANFSEGERGMAYGIWAGVSTLGLSLGPLAGGLLVEGLSWRWIFFVNLPFGAAALAVARRVISESRDTSADQRLDVPGLTASGVALFALVFALVEGNNYGWSSSRIVVALVLSACGFVLFLALESRRSSPMLDLSLFRNSTFTGANIGAMLIMLTMIGVLFFVSIYLQSVLGYSPVQAGAAFLPMTILFMLTAPAAGKLTDEIGSRWPIAAGMALIATSLVLFSRLDTSSNFWDLVPALAVGGLGMGLAMAPTTTTAIGSVPVDKAGVGSGVLNTFRQGGGALGVALMGAIVTRDLHNVAPGSRAFALAFVNGFQNALLVCAAIAGAGAAIAALTIKQRRRQAQTVPIAAP